VAALPDRPWGQVMRWRRLFISTLVCTAPASAAAESPRQTIVSESQSKPVASVRELIQMGGAMADMKRFDEAITAYTLALQQEPDNWEARADRALAYAWINKLKEASDDLAAAEKIMPESAVSHRVKAILANRRSDEDTELAELTKSLLLEPENPFALSFRASIYAERQQYEAALADAEAYIRARPDEPYAY
jgi:regulator of sirC expression with transglutaminase-like and TPR domain